MATQAVVSIVKNKHTFIKAICGCNGYNAKKLANAIKNNKLENIQDIYNEALKIKFGCKDCLVVMNKDTIMFEGDDDFHLYPLYRETFDISIFNPRWKYGTADYIIMIDESGIIELEG